MRIVGKLLRILLVLIVVVAAAVTGLVGAVTLRGLPQQDGAIQVAGLESSATVLRDEHGIVNIYADNPHDLFLAQGYVHAQERLWQMEVWRHISSGRLSELFGKSTLDQDRFIRTLGWRQSAERDFATALGGAAGDPGRLRAGRERVHRGASRLARDGVRRDRDAERDRRHRRLRPRAVDGARLAGVAEGPGLAARRQLRLRGVPDAGRRAPRRPRADGSAVPGLLGRDAGHHAVRRGGDASLRRRRRGASARPACCRDDCRQAAAWREVAATRQPGHGDRRPRRRRRAWPATTRSGRTTGSSPRRAARRTPRCSPTIRISASRCRRSGS